MAEVLELTQLLQDDRVTEVDVRSGGIETQLDAQRTSLLGDGPETLLERPGGKRLSGVAPQESGLGGGIGTGGRHPGQC